MTQPKPAPEEIQRQASKILTQVAGYIGVRTMEMGLSLGLFERIAEHPQGITSDELAEKQSIDPFYCMVWCRSAYAAEVLDLGDRGAYTLAPHMDRILLDKDFPGFMGALPGLIVQPEMFDRFAENLPSGQRTWWDQCSPTWIQMVSGTGRSFYNRLIPAGLSRIPGLTERLDQEARVAELACGAGIGLAKLASQYPRISLVGVDGDSYSLELALDNLSRDGLEGRASLVCSSLEDWAASDEYDVVINNISMHECRDIEKATANIYAALKPDGYFVISDFPFPESTEECRTIPGRFMSGVQFFEAQIDDQLLSVRAYVDLLTKHGFRNVGSVDISPVHALTYGQK